MDIRELRIGNYVKVSGKICHVVSILSKSSANTFERVIVEDCNGIHSGGLMEIIEPIPLTEYILLKCGFSESDLVFGVTTSGSHFAFEWSKKRRSIDIFEKRGKGGAFFDILNGVEIKHLHQLQNLIFVLSGEELDVKL